MKYIMLIYQGTARTTRGALPSPRPLGARKWPWFARNRRLADALDMWAFCSLSSSSGARHHYAAHRAKGNTHHQALRSLANRWVGILHGCLRHRQVYSELLAWSTTQEAAA